MAQGFTLNTLSSILLDIAKRHKAHPYSRINTYGIVDTFEQLALDNLGKDEDDFDKGYYWQRGGFNPEKCSEDLRLITMLRGCTRERINKKIKCLELLIGVSQREQCVGCPEGYNKGSIEIDAQNEDVLFSVIDQLLSYRLYTVTFTESPGESVQIFATPKQIERYKQDDIMITCKDCGMTIESKVQNKRDIQCRYDCIGPNKIRLAWVTLTICGCHVEDQEFEDKPAEDEEFAYVKCASCL